MQRLRPLLPLFVFPLLASCQYLDRAPAEESPPVMAEATPQPTAPTPRDPLVFTAECTGNTVRFQIENNIRQGLLVAPESMALVTTDNEVIYARDDAVLSRFYPTMLDLGQTVVGELIFLTQEDVTGARLVYHSTQLAPANWTTEIVGAQAPAPDGVYPAPQ